MKFSKLAPLGAALILTLSMAACSPSTSRTIEDNRPPVVTEDVVPVTALVPKVVGLSVVEAQIALASAGLAVDVNDSDPMAIVIGASPGEGEQVEIGTTVVLTVEEKPQLTLAQQNAVESAQSYLDFMGFSRTGLIKQLEYEGYSTADATFAVDNAGADWFAEATESAASYLSTMSFSRDGLYAQLEYEGFTPDEINHALAMVGY